MRPFVTACHRCVDGNFIDFCMSAEKEPQLMYTSLYRIETKTIVFHIKQRFFLAVLHSSSLNVLLVTGSYHLFVFEKKAKWRENWKGWDISTTKRSFKNSIVCFSLCTKFFHFSGSVVIGLALPSLPHII